MLKVLKHRELGSCRAREDLENPFVLHRQPQAHPLVAQLRSNWWLWSTLAFAVCLIGSLTLFRGSLYDSGAHGLPFLAGAALPGALSPAALKRTRRHSLTHDTVARLVPHKRWNTRFKVRQSGMSPQPCALASSEGSLGWVVAAPAALNSVWSLCGDVV